ELITALIADYAGYEEIRLRLSTCGTGYGRDCAEADAVAQRLIEAFCDEVESHRNLRGGCFTPGLWSFLQNVEIGRRTAASPEGRHAGQPISHSMDPVSGKAINGPTAVLNSAAGLCQHRLSNGGSLLLEFSTNVLKDPQGCAAAQALCETYLQMGGIELQLSCASVEQLLAAREHPEQYRDLVVRIAGYSDFFVRVSPELQAYIIEREKHVM
ncbi:MAG TPA: glycine radical domain-containing protein, partial [Armatimonadota bacterium]